MYFRHLTAHSWEFDTLSGQDVIPSDYIALKNCEFVSIDNYV